MADPFTCPLCGKVSHNLRDAEERYCGRCHLFVDDEAEVYGAIIDGRVEPDPIFYQAGWDAHAAGKEFHEGPTPHLSVEGLCWRMGWNGRALAQRDG